jgi:hypothetical protein
MLIPSLAFLANCIYCFSLLAGGRVISQGTVEAVIEWQKAFMEGKRLRSPSTCVQTALPVRRLLPRLEYLRPGYSPQDCTALKERARSLLVSALKTLDVEMGQWLTAGPPIE